MILAPVPKDPFLKAIQSGQGNFIFLNLFSFSSFQIIKASRNGYSKSELKESSL